MAGVGAFGGPAPGNQVAFGQDQINRPGHVREGSPELGGDLFLSGRSRRSISAAQIMPDVVLGKDIINDVVVAFVPNLLPEAKSGLFVLRWRHLEISPSDKILRTRCRVVLPLAIPLQAAAAALRLSFLRGNARTALKRVKAVLSVYKNTVHLY